MSGGLCFFVWGEHVAQWTPLEPAGGNRRSRSDWSACRLVDVGREESVPSKGILSVVSFCGYTPVGCDWRCDARHSCCRFLLLIMVIGLGAWIGLPTVLQPVERIASLFGADLNDVPGYVDAKHLFTGLKTDDWIALDEGSWFYMPSLYPAASFSQAMQVLQTQDALIKEIPEVDCVLGKIGRVESALDPAPAAMVETYVMLKPREQWRSGVTERDDLG